MTLIVGAICQDGIVLAADRRRVVRYEKGPETTKLFKLYCGVVLAGAGDDAVLNEARILIDKRITEFQNQSSSLILFDVVEITASVVNELVNCYRDKIEESFGYALAGLEKINSGNAKLYTVFGAGLSEVPWVCLGSGSPYARPLVDLLLSDGNLRVNDAIKIIAPLFTLVSNVQTTVGDGVDICIIADERGPGDIVYHKEVNLDRLKLAILNNLGIKT